MVARYVLPALAVASGAAAATCSVAGTTTVTNTVQASSLASCQTFTGTIAIATGATDIALDGIERIEGSLVSTDSSSLVSLSADSLTTITDEFRLVDDTILSSLTFPDLTSVKTIYWQGLANLQGLSFSSAVQTATTVLIDNTELGDLDGIDLQTVGSITLTNNRFLETIDMQLTNITATPGLVVSANGDDVSLTLANLVSAYGLNIQNVTTLSLDSLSSVTGTLGFYSNFFDTLSCPNLTSVSKELAIDANSDLTSISMPELKTIGGGFQIENNTALAKITFPKLTTVDGAVDFTGVFTSVKLAALKLVKGGFSIASTKDITSSCKVFSAEQGANSVIEGAYSCKGSDAAAKTATGAVGSASASSSSSSSSSTSSSSAGQAAILSGATGVLGVVAALFGML